MLRTVLAGVLAVVAAAPVLGSAAEPVARTSASVQVLRGDTFVALPAGGVLRAGDRVQGPGATLAYADGCSQALPASGVIRIANASPCLLRAQDQEQGQGQVQDRDRCEDDRDDNDDGCGGLLLPPGRTRALLAGGAAAVLLFASSIDGEGGGDDLAPPPGQSQ